MTNTPSNPLEMLIARADQQTYPDPRTTARALQVLARQLRLEPGSPETAQAVQRQLTRLADRFDSCAANQPDPNRVLAAARDLHDSLMQGPGRPRCGVLMDALADRPRPGAKRDGQQALTQVLTAARHLHDALTPPAMLIASGMAAE